MFASLIVSNSTALPDYPAQPISYSSSVSLFLPTVSPKKTLQTLRFLNFDKPPVLDSIPSIVITTYP